MTDDLVVVADGAEIAETSRRKGQSSQIVLALVSFALGLGLGVIVVPQTEEPVVEESASEVAAPVLETIPRVTDSGLGELIPDLTDSLVVMVERGSGGFDRLVWPADRQLTESNAGFGDEVSLDRSGQLLATTQSVPGLDGAILAVGRISTPEPVDSNVTSFSWHDTKAGHISYVTEAEGEWSLWRIRPNSDSSQVGDGSLGPGSLVAWGDWGWAIQRDGEIVLLTPEGELKTSMNGRILTSHGSGWLLVVDDGLELVSAGGGVVKLDVAADRVGAIATAAFAPDGETLAVAGERGVLVFAASGEGAILEIASIEPSIVAFSSDGRFVTIASSGGVQIYDLETGNNSFVLTLSMVESVRMVAGSS